LQDADSGNTAEKSPGREEMMVALISANCFRHWSIFDEIPALQVRFS
jgi:uncharacterized protein YbaR (Trm112 family)